MAKGNRDVPPGMETFCTRHGGIQNPGSTDAVGVFLFVDAQRAFSTQGCDLSPYYSGFNFSRVDESQPYEKRHCFTHQIALRCNTLKHKRETR